MGGGETEKMQCKTLKSTLMCLINQCGLPDLVNLTSDLGWFFRMEVIPLSSMELF